jgi:hypothetical protein
MIGRSAIAFEMTNAKLTTQSLFLSSGPPAQHVASGERKWMPRVSVPIMELRTFLLAFI